MILTDEIILTEKNISKYMFEHDKRYSTIYMPNYSTVPQQVQITKIIFPSRVSTCGDVHFCHGKKILYTLRFPDDVFDGQKVKFNLEQNPITFISPADSYLELNFKCGSDPLNMFSFGPFEIHIKEYNNEYTRKIPKIGRGNFMDAFSANDMVIDEVDSFWDEMH